MDDDAVQRCVFSLKSGRAIDMTQCHRIGFSEQRRLYYKTVNKRTENSMFACGHVSCRVRCTVVT